MANYHSVSFKQPPQVNNYPLRHDSWSSEESVSSNHTDISTVVNAPTSMHNTAPASPIPDGSDESDISSEADGSCGLPETYSQRVSPTQHATNVKKVELNNFQNKTSWHQQNNSSVNFPSNHQRPNGMHVSPKKPDGTVADQFLQQRNYPDNKNSIPSNANTPYPRLAQYNGYGNPTILKSSQPNQGYYNTQQPPHHDFANQFQNHQSVSHPHSLNQSQHVLTHNMVAYVPSNQPQQQNCFYKPNQFPANNHIAPRNPSTEQIKLNSQRRDFADYPHESELQAAYPAHKLGYQTRMQTIHESNHFNASYPYNTKPNNDHFRPQPYFHNPEVFVASNALFNKPQGQPVHSLQQPHEVNCFIALSFI